MEVPDQLISTLRDLCHPISTQMEALQQVVRFETDCTRVRWLHTYPCVWLTSCVEGTRTGIHCFLPLLAFRRTVRTRICCTCASFLQGIRCQTFTKFGREY